jgi:hypothetical protein
MVLLVEFAAPAGGAGAGTAARECLSTGTAARECGDTGAAIAGCCDAANSALTVLAARTNLKKCLVLTPTLLSDRYLRLTQSDDYCQPCSRRSARS